MRREDILNAAVRVATADGIAALSVRRVAAESGIGATTLRHYFPSQAELRAAVLKEMSGGSLADGNIADPSIPALDRLADRLDQFLLLDDRRRAEVDLILRLRETPTESLGLVVRGAYAITFEAVARWLTVLSTEGQLSSADIEPSAFQIVTFLDGLSMRHLHGIKDEPGELRLHLRQFLEVVLATGSKH